MELREFLLKQRDFADENGNTVSFFDRGLDTEPKENEFWLFLDEGLRCGGTARKIPCDKQHLQEVLLGCGKKELWQRVLEGISRWEEENR